MMPGMDIQIRRAFEVMLAAEGTANVVTAILRWREVTGKTADYDPGDESSAVDLEVTEGSRSFRALFHQVDHRLSGFQRFMEVQTGDVMLDYLDDLELDGKEDVRVEVNGRMYVQKSASKGLLESWDVTMGTSGISKTLLLTPVP